MATKTSLPKNKDVEKIRKALDDQGLRNDKFAKRCGYTPNYLSYILNYNPKFPLTEKAKDKFFSELNIKKVK